MLSKSISTSEKFARLKTDQARLLFCLIVPHTDDYGILSGEPFSVKMVCAPATNWSLDKVSEYLTDLRDVGLIYWYTVKEKLYLQVVNFDEHQAGLHKRTDPKLPTYSGDFPAVPGNSGKFREIPPELKGTELNLNEPNIYTRVFERWNENAPPLTKHAKLAGAFKTNVERAINGRIEEGFTEDDILKAIQNYADVITDQNKYYFSHKWTLDTFCRQRNALPNFVDAATPLTNYLRDKTSPPNASAPTSPPKYVPETDVPQWVIDQYSHDPCKLYYIRDQWNFMGRRWDDINVKVYITEEMREWWRKSKHNPENQGISE